MLSALLTFFAVGLVSLILAGIVLAILGFLFSVALALAGFLLFKVAPVVLVGYVILRLLDRRRSRRQLTAADRRWLEGE